MHPLLHNIEPPGPNERWLLAIGSAITAWIALQSMVDVALARLFP